MDDLVKSLGPFAKRILAKDTPVRAKTAAIIKKKEITNFSAFHKKNSRFGRNIEESRPVRSKQVEDRRKANRDQLIMEKRAGLVKANVNSTRVEEKVPDVSISNGIKESRKEQLSRWKQEKEAIKNATVGNKRVPFKAPAPAGSQNFPTFPIPLPPVKSGINSRVGKVAMNAQQEKKVNNKNGTNGIAGTTSRVTRSMAKAQVGNQTSVVNGMGTAISRLRDMKINTTKAAEIPPKAPSSAKSRKLDNSQPGSQIKKGIPRSVNSTQNRTPQNSQLENSSGSVSLSGSSSSGTPSPLPNNRSHALADKVQNGNLVPIEPPKKIKKPKGMQFDDKYLEYNESFVRAGKLLQNYSNQWNHTLTERTDIPEDIVGQINSAVGQAKLLLDSKLPQFAELLYFYLSRHQDPGPVLPCDLEGWWDVANISVEKVRDIFEELAVLEGNAWVKPVELPKPKPVTAPALKKSNEVVKPKPRPNAGLLAFLAQKRKNTNSAENKAESGDGNSDNNVKSKSKSPSPHRQFEGGFFEIRSPARRTCSPAVVHSNSRKSALIRSTPRRQSEISLRMLAVRNSMGPICKIGVLEKPQEPEIPTVPEYMDPLPTKSLSNSIFRQKLLNYLTRPTKFPCFLYPNIEYFVNARKGVELYPIELNDICEAFSTLQIASPKRKGKNDCTKAKTQVENRHNGSGDFGPVEIRRIEYQDICTIAMNERLRSGGKENFSSQDINESSFNEELSISSGLSPSRKVPFFDHDIRNRKSPSFISNENLKERKVSVSPFILKFYGSPWNQLMGTIESSTNIQSYLQEPSYKKHRNTLREVFPFSVGGSYAHSVENEYEAWTATTAVSIGTDRFSDIELDPNDILDPEVEYDSTCSSSSYTDELFEAYSFMHAKRKPNDLFLKSKYTYEECRTRRTKPRSSRNKKYRIRSQRGSSGSVTRRRGHGKGSDSDQAQIDSMNEDEDELDKEQNYAEDYVMQEYSCHDSVYTSSKLKLHHKAKPVIKKKIPVVRSQPSRPLPPVPVKIRRLKKYSCTQHLTQYKSESTSQNSGQNNPESEFRSSSGILKKTNCNREFVRSYVKITKESIRTLECTRDVRITRTQEWVLLSDPSFGSGSHKEKSCRSRLLLTDPRNNNDLLTSDIYPDSNSEQLTSTTVPSAISACTNNDESLKNSSDELKAISEPKPTISPCFEFALSENQYSSNESLTESFSDMGFDDDDDDDISYIESVARYERLASVLKSKSPTNSVASDVQSCKEFWDDGEDDEQEKYDELPQDSEQENETHSESIILGSETTSLQQPLSMNLIEKLLEDESNSFQKFPVGSKGEGDHVNVCAKLWGVARSDHTVLL